MKKNEKNSMEKRCPARHGRKYKSGIYTAVLAVASLLVVFGGWFFTREMLERRKAEFLSGSGVVALRAEQTALLAQEEAEADAPFEPYELAEEQMRDILTMWNLGGKEMPHEPKEDQMNMEQAIEAGREWIASLAEHEVVPTELTNGDFEKITAQLSTLEVSTSLDERLVSLWTMEYMKGDVNIKLTIHAMSGEIWEARIYMLATSSMAYMYSSKELLEMMFPRVIKSKEEAVSIYDRRITEVLEEGFVSVEFDFSTVGTVSYDAIPTFNIMFWLEPLG